MQKWKNDFSLDMIQLPNCSFSKGKCRQNKKLTEESKVMVNTDNIWEFCLFCGFGFFLNTILLTLVKYWFWLNCIFCSDWELREKTAAFQRWASWKRVWIAPERSGNKSAEEKKNERKQHSLEALGKVKHTLDRQQMINV